MRGSDESEGQGQGAAGLVRWARTMEPGAGERSSTSYACDPDLESDCRLHARAMAQRPSERT